MGKNMELCRAMGGASLGKARLLKEITNNNILIIIMMIFSFIEFMIKDIDKPINMSINHTKLV